MTSAVATQFLPAVAAASATRDYLVVSLHDVAPSTQMLADKILSELAQRGIRHCSLLVVPNYHHLGASMQDRRFISWLRNLEATGHEIVIHGYFHEHSRRRAAEGFLEKFVTQIYTQGEGEFYDLSYDEAFRRIRSARDEFEAAGLKPRGFVAPAWLLCHEAERAARDAEMEYTTRLRTVRDLRSSETFRACSMVYSVRNGWRRATSLAWNAALSRVQRDQSLVRMSIHPPDFSHPAIWRQIVELISKMVPLRMPATYQDWIGEQRSKRGL
jgi:predicted deacetylase